MTKFQALAHKYGTPLYVYDFDTIDTKFSALKEVFKARKSIDLFCRKIKLQSFRFKTHGISGCWMRLRLHWRS